MQGNHAAIVYNPVTVPIERVRRAADTEALRQGWDQARWYATSSDDGGRRAAEEALTADPAVVIVGGGDGTVRTVAEAIHESGKPLAVLPTGTGNLLARNLGLPLGDIERSIRIALSGATRRIDIAVAELEDEDGHRSRHVFLVMAGIGLDAEMAANTSALSKRRLGWFAYVTPIARSIMANRQFHLRYRIDGGHTRSARAHTIIVGNCGTLTGNMLLLPTALIDDGLLDVIMLRPTGRFGWARIGTRLTVQGIANRSRFGKSMLRLAPDLQALVYAQGRELEARFDNPRGVQLDGDGFGPIVAARITVRPSALHVRVEDGT